MTFPDFARFFEQCHDEEPYLWQRRLADEVLTDRRWPPALDLPAGSGKTSAIDIALYALAAAAHEGEFGIFPRRIVLVADRRVLVDQAWRHGERLLERIESKTELALVRRALAKLSPEEPPSSVRLRGACPPGPAMVPFPGSGPDRRLNGRPDRLADSHARLCRLAAHAIRGGRLATRSIAVFGHRWDSKQFLWPLCRLALAWSDVSAALAGNSFSLQDALWCEAPRLFFGTSQNRSYGFGAERPRWM